MFNHLFEFNPASMNWKDLTKMMDSKLPAPTKDSTAFTSLGGKLYRFGGLGFQGYHPRAFKIIFMISIIDHCF